MAQLIRCLLLAFCGEDEEHDAERDTDMEPLQRPPCCPQIVRGLQDDPYRAVSQTEPRECAREGDLQKQSENENPESCSPLRTALSFDRSHQVLSIHEKEIVIPGSELQREMAIASARGLEVQMDECVICMEGFDESNPRMPTLCGCGAVCTVTEYFFSL